MATLFMTNVPYNCSDSELSDWVRSSGIEVKSIRMIRDLVSGVSPAFAYVDIDERVRTADAVAKLNGRNIRERIILVRLAQRATAAA